MYSTVLVVGDLDSLFLLLLPYDLATRQQQKKEKEKNPFHNPSQDFPFFLLPAAFRYSAVLLLL